MNEKFYVYKHILGGEVIYVGKGSRYRKNISERRGKLWHDIVGDRISEVEVEIVKRFCNEEDAYEYEKKLILYYKRIGQCEANVSLGKYHAETTKKLISKKGKGANNSMYGKAISREHRRNLSKAKSGKNNPYFDKTGGNHNYSKSAEAIFPNGKKITAPSRNELAKVLKEDFDISESMTYKLILSGKALKGVHKRHEKARGLVVKYIE